METKEKIIDELKEYREQLSKLSDAEKKFRDLYLKDLADGTLQGPPTGYSSIDKSWFKYYENDKLNLDVPKKSMFQYFADEASKHLDNIAVDLRMSFNKFDKSIKTLTYRQFLEEVVTISCGLQVYGLEVDEILLEMLPNFIESRESIYAANAIGTTVYPVSPMLPTSKLEEIINLNGIKSVVIYGGFYDKFKDTLNNKNIEQIIYLNGLESFNPILRKLVMLTDKEGKYTLPDDKRIITWEKVIKAGKKYRKKHKIKSYKNLKAYYKENHIATIVGTSGTTGIPKGACLSDYAINACDFSEEIPHPFETGEVNLDVLIQSISYGIGIMHHTMCGGLKNIIIPELVTDKVAMLLKKFKPAHFSGGPIHYENIVKSPEYLNGELPKPKNYLCGGATLSSKTEKELNGNVDSSYIEPKTGESKIFVRQGLGSTENTGTGVFTTRGSYKFGSVGIPIALSNCAVFKYGTDEELRTGEIGEICMSGPTMMEEYLNNPEETRKVIKVHSDGTKWLHLGDEGYMDKDGHVYMIDRYKNIFMRNGFNVHPTKIREIILKSDSVLDCHVVGVDHPIEMSVPVAFVILKDDVNESQIIDELNKLCFDNLDEYFIPYEYKFVREIPVNLGGKVDSRKLIEDNKINYTESSERKMNLR